MSELIYKGASPWDNLKVPARQGGFGLDVMSSASPEHGEISSNAAASLAIVTGWVATESKWTLPLLT